MKKSLLILAAALLSVGLATPLATHAEEVDTTAGVGKSVVTSWIKALDGQGDANAIGKFKSTKANKKLFHVNGTVSAVSNESITVTNGNKTFTFDVDSKTNVIRRFKGTGSIDEVMVGDKVSVWATKKTEGTAKLIWDKSIWRVSVKGTVAALDATSQTFSVVITKMEPHTGLLMTLTVPVVTNDNTEYHVGTAEGTFADLADGQTVTVNGSWNALDKNVLADKVTIEE